MPLQWIHETPARWDAPKTRIIGGAPAGVFNLPRYREGELLAGDWWRAEDAGTVVGYGWLDVVWGEAEILLAVDPAAQRRGVGAFILDRLEAEAHACGVNYVFNTVTPAHPDGARVTAWLQAHGFTATEDGELRRRVASAPQR